jgi:membrane protease YdiL (CAAX protease family)
VIPTETTILHRVQTQRALLDTMICSVAFAAFAFLVIYPFPLKAAAFIPLVAAAFIMSRNINWALVSRKLLFQNALTPGMLVYNLVGLQMGIAGAMYYRGSFGMPVIPEVFRSFTLVAVGIGITEELVFRGFIQGRLSKISPAFAIVFAAFAHASYKVFLFLSPAAQHLPSITLFFTLTFGALVLIGLLRYFSKSVLPAIMVHAVFDLLVYAENLQAPWWVW